MDKVTAEALEEYYTKWIGEKSTKVAGRTADGYRRAIGPFLEFIGNGGHTEVTGEALREFRDRQEGLIDSGVFAVSTVNVRIAFINRFLADMAGDEGAPKLEVRRFREETKKVLSDVVEIEEYRAIVAKCRELGDKTTELIVRAIAETGCRVAELKFFSVPNLRKGGLLEIKNKGKYRFIAVPDGIRRELLSYAAGRGITGIIFCQEKDPGKMLSTATIWRRLQRVGRAAGVDSSKLHCHSFRKLHARMLERSGVPLSSIARSLGHSSVATTAKTYLLPTEKEWQQEANRHESLFEV